MRASLHKKMDLKVNSLTRCKMAVKSNKQQPIYIYLTGLSRALEELFAIVAYPNPLKHLSVLDANFLVELRNVVIETNLHMLI